MSTYIYRVASGISMYFKAFPGRLYAQNKILAKYMLDQKTINYFTSCDPHHDIYTCSYWQIFWHSI